MHNSNEKHNTSQCHLTRQSAGLLQGLSLSVSVSKTSGLKYWHFCSEIEGFERVSSVEHIRRGVVLYVIVESHASFVTAHMALTGADPGG